MKINYSSKTYLNSREEDFNNQKDNFAASELVKPSLDLQDLKKAPRKIKENIATFHTSSLKRVHQNKLLVQNLAQLQRGMANIKNRVELEELIDKSSVKQLLLKRNSDAAEEYGKGKPLMIRSLRFSSPGEVHGKIGAEGKTPVKREVDTICNKSTLHDIVMTPASLIKKEVRMNLISEVPRPKNKQKYRGLPSVVYGQGSLVNESDYLSSRNGFGDVHSFKSNNAFNPDYEKTSRSLSHAEKLGLIESNLTPFIKHDPDRIFPAFAHSIEELTEHQMMLQSRKPASTLRHNEYCTKFELWDAKAIAVGESRSLAVATLIEFNLEMLSIAQEIEDDGHRSQMVADFIERQLSWLGPQAALDRKSTLERVSSVTVQERRFIADEICRSLRRGVSLCTYNRDETGSHIREMSLLNFSAEEIMEGIKIFNSSKILHDTNAGEE
ncbi:AvrBs1/Avra family type III secretion system effector [Xanthomonas vesicatoria]|uniref:Avirulence protein n=3 Tax=Xanthomonas vesicatoria TaxID=56460 RepID=A0ABS8LBL3_9XANT|nr:AvrBs1/Avra family type III secretion system effector [Xanthomonas vesicatoria]APO93975.1 avirulence protein [Xanthomonas vesicatoria]MCC8623144.1 avirulence protein [Xanthomonas vesicatoria]MCC8694963.1 avirulence protein [Xanthomonas vesicatoria]MCC8702335.1 avirulence protein [Xanthomonas vesicatoria]MDG4488796.1 avirulence protein [Xanthomonas vesicatoria]